MLQRQPPLTIPLGTGPDQSTARLFRDGTQVLADVRNGEMGKAGGVRKARGFGRIALTTTVHGETPESVFVSVGVSHGELVLVGKSNFYSVAAPTAAIDGAALVLRGPSMVGAFEIGLVHASSQGDD
jgi:hypothetical protein